MRREADIQVNDGTNPKRHLPYWLFRKWRARADWWVWVDWYLLEV